MPEIPDYALDKHTHEGKVLGRGVEHWRDEGCQLHPESDVADPYAGEAYEWWGGDFIRVKWPPRKLNGDGPVQARLF